MAKKKGTLQEHCAKKENIVGVARATARTLQIVWDVSHVSRHKTRGLFAVCNSIALGRKQRDQPAVGGIEQPRVRQIGKHVVATGPGSEHHTPGCGRDLGLLSTGACIIDWASDTNAFNLSIYRRVIIR